MLNTANCLVVPMKQNISVTCFSSEETKPKSFLIPSAITDLKKHSPWNAILRDKKTQYSYPLFHHELQTFL